MIKLLMHQNESEYGSMLLLLYIHVTVVAIVMYGLVAPRVL